jgi:anti-sigma factor RsiW
MLNRLMADTEYLELIHAEIDGELDGGQRSELARRVLADPAVRAVRDDLRRLCAKLDAIEEVEPPAQLRTNILQGLPISATPAAEFSNGRLPRWRYAALIAGVLGATASCTRPWRHGTGSAELAGTIAARALH